MIWVPVIVASLGAYLTKLIGFVLPTAWLESPFLRRLSGLLPIGLLAALVSIQTFSTGQHWTIDARAAGLAVAIVALILRAPFIVVVVIAALTAALLRSIGWAS